VPVRDLRVWGRVWCRGVLAHSTAGEGSWCWLEAGVVYGQRVRGGVRVRGGGPVTDGGLRVLGGGLLGFYVAGSGQI